MKYLSISLLKVFLVLLLLGGCDTYSLKSSLTTGGGPLDLTLEKSQIKPWEVCRLYPSGGVPPYRIEVFEDQIYHNSIESSLGGVDDNFLYTSGYSLGKVGLRLRDSAGVSITRSILVLPTPPLDFLVDNSDGNDLDVTLSWSTFDPYTQGNISGFLIEKSVGDTKNYAPLAEVSGGINTYTDHVTNPVITNYYRIYSKAGDYLSQPVLASGSGKP